MEYLGFTLGASHKNDQDLLRQLHILYLNFSISPYLQYPTNFAYRILKSRSIEKPLIQFIHCALNGNEMCKQILFVKLKCKKSSFAENYRYLSWNYNFSDS